MTYVTCWLTAKNRDQLQNPTLGNRVWATFTFLRLNPTQPNLTHALTVKFLDTTQINPWLDQCMMTTHCLVWYTNLKILSIYITDIIVLYVKAETGSVRNHTSLNRPYY